MSRLQQLVIVVLIGRGDSLVAQFHLIPSAGYNLEIIVSHRTFHCHRISDAIPLTIVLDSHEP